MLDRWLFTLPSITWRHWTVPLFGIGGTNIERIRFGPIDFGGDSAQTVLLAIVFGAFTFLVVAIRRSKYGRMLLAMRESETACATLGLGRRRVKLTVFALSAGMAGVGGALLGGVYENATPNYFTFLGGLQVLLLAVVGGIGAVSGAALAVFFIFLTEWVGRTYPGTADLINVLPGLAGIGLARNPGGVASDLAGLFGRFRAGSGRPTGEPDRQPAGSETLAPALPVASGDGR